MPKDREERLGDNERLIRDANEEHAAEAVEWASGEMSLVADEELEFWCACGRPDCDVKLVLTVGEYEAVHRLPHRFVVAEGHENPEIERIVERQPATTWSRSCPSTRPSASRPRCRGLSSRIGTARFELATS